MTDPRRLALLSFPKCGRTWLKVMLKTYFERTLAVTLILDEAGHWHQESPRIPRLSIEHDGNPHFARAETLDPDRSRFADVPVALIVRDPRDVMVSLYFEMTRRTRFYEDWGFDVSSIDRDGPISEFIRGPIGRLEALLAYYRLWDAARSGIPHFELIRYEDMHQDPEAALTTVLRLGGVEVDPTAVRETVEACRFERMRKAEERNTYESLTLLPADRADPESFKVRKGKVGGYVEYLTPEDLAYIDARCASLPESLASYRSS